jgi:hypothetical protein
MGEKNRKTNNSDDNKCAESRGKKTELPSPPTFPWPYKTRQELLHRHSKEVWIALWFVERPKTKEEESDLTLSYRWSHHLLEWVQSCYASCPPFPNWPGTRCLLFTSLQPSTFILQWLVYCPPTDVFSSWRNGVDLVSWADICKPVCTSTSEKNRSPAVRAPERMFAAERTFSCAHVQALKVPTSK